MVAIPPPSPPLGGISAMPAVTAVNGTELIPCIYSGVVANYTLTPVQIQAWLQSATTISADLDQLGNVQGDTLFRGSTGWQALPPGNPNQVLTAAGPGANPFWGISPIVAALIYG